MLNKIARSECCGCAACYNCCPTNSIKMEYDREGFLYPVIDAETCIECSLCEKSCPVIGRESKHLCEREPQTIAVKSKDNETRKESSSGGIFSHLAKYVLERNGVVFGAAFSDDYMSVSHIEISSVLELERLRGSKYVQSAIEDSYRKVKGYLEKERLVLFTGTPCQIEGLRSYLKKDYEKLICVDLICHGVPSPLVWRKHLEYREGEANSKAVKVSFRNKSLGWKQYSLQIEFKNGAVYKCKGAEDGYIQSFLRDLSLRSSCYNCKFKGINRNSDLTLADFWGIEKILPQLDDDKGTSLVFVHSVKGERLISQINDEMELENVDCNKAIEKNPSMCQSVSYNKNRDKFIAMVNEQGFYQAYMKYVYKSESQKIVIQMKRAIKRVLRRR